MEIGSSMSWIASVVRLVTGLEPAAPFASFSFSTENVDSAVMMPPMVTAMCNHARNVLSLAAIRRSTGHDKLSKAVCHEPAGIQEQLGSKGVPK